MQVFSIFLHSFFQVLRWFSNDLFDMPANPSKKPDKRQKEFSNYAENPPYYSDDFLCAFYNQDAKGEIVQQKSQSFTQKDKKAHLSKIHRHSEKKGYKAAEDKIKHVLHNNHSSRQRNCDSENSEQIVNYP